MNFDKAISIIKEVSGTQLTKYVVNVFMRLVERGEFREIDDFGNGTIKNIDNIQKNFILKLSPSPKLKDEGFFIVLQPKNLSIMRSFGNVYVLILILFCYKLYV